MRIKYHRVESKKEEPLMNINQNIKALELFLIDENNEAIGVVSLEEALRLANEAELDLVEVNPKGNPPVAKISNFGQLKYEKEKLAHKQKMQQKKVEQKNIRLSFRISDHDLDLRVNQAIKFLTKENKIKVELILRGRERQYPKKAAEIINSFLEKVKENQELNVEVEQPLTNQGGRFTMILVNKK